MNPMITAQLERLLHRVRLLTPSSRPAGSTSEEEGIYNQICKLVFRDQAYRELWDERVLTQLNMLFQVNPPQLATYGQQVAEIGQRALQTQRVNDFFFRILNRDASTEDVHEALTAISLNDLSLLSRLKSSDRLTVVREADTSPSEKITAFLNYLRDDVGLDLCNQEPVKGCLETLKWREGAGGVNALLIKADGESAVQVVLQIKVQNGSGQVHCVVHSRDDFEAALKRARLALLDRGLLRDADDVVCTLELTEPQYLGTSICLAAAIGIYGAARGTMIDPYTAFTGDINLDRGYWRVKSVSGLPLKLEAARLSGCRRVFVPRENLKEGDFSKGEALQVIPVDDLLEVFLQLQAPLQPLSGESLQVRKINSIKAFCQSKGWQLSPSQAIQDGIQFRVVPLLLPELTVTIYDTGAHQPKKHDRLEYQELTDVLQAAEESRIPLRKIEQQFHIRDPELRRVIQEGLERLQPADRHQESHCQYVVRFERGQERLVIKQYEKGTLQIQGTAGELYKDVLGCIVSRYNLHYPNAQHSIQALLATKEKGQTGAASSPIASHATEEIPFPHIGTDESGKGDYFGPMVVAGVFLDSQTKPRLETLGVKDSKLLSDKQCRQIAAKIREICRGKYEEVEIPPDRYNELYESFRKEGKNLNVLLAWGHARAIESLLERRSCTHAVADQFGDEHYILSKLMEKGKKLKLVQLPKGERYLAVAAASILARDKFLARLGKLSDEYGIQLPKGSADIVVRAAKQIVERKGPEELRKVAKLHHKTTQKILGRE